jgi:riboflavin kinase/FMN adenylyltransferase
MRVVRHLNAYPEDLRGGAVVIGNFDGVHRGHQALIAACREVAGELGGAATALTFEPHPRQVFAPDSPPFRLTPFRSKAQLMGAYGLDALAALRFQPSLYGKTAEDFVRDVLVAGLGARHVVVGYDFVFGYKRGGNVDLLQRMGENLGFGVTVVQPVTHGDDVCSSTIIRVDLETGRARRAADLLGHWWEVQGRVRGGDRRGRQLGFPTANLHMSPAALRPARGVYAVHFGVEECGATEWYPAVANLGTRPTFDGTGVVLEVHLFEFSGDLYGRHARVAFVEHLRPEKKFNGIDEIKAQIDADCTAARELLKKPENAVTAVQSAGISGRPV